MLKIIKELNIDVTKPNVFQAVVAKQYDVNSRFLKVTFTDCGNRVDIPMADTNSVIINAERSDGKSDGFYGEINDDGTVTVPLHSWILEKEGTVSCDISVLCNDNQKLTTTTFTLLVEKAAYGGEDITTDPQYDVLMELIEQVNNAGGGTGDGNIKNAVGISNTASGTTVEISADDEIYTTDITVDTENDPDITFSGKNLIDDSLFLDYSKWTYLTADTRAYILDVPSGTYTFSVGKKQTKPSYSQYIDLDISSDNFTTKTSTRLINGVQWKTDTVTFTLQEGEKARVWRYAGSKPTIVDDIFCDVMLEKGNTRSEYVPYFKPFSLSYEDVKSLRIPAFDKYVTITNSEDANMQVTYTVGGSLYDYIGKTSMDSREDYAWIGDGDGETDYTEIIQSKIEELKTLNNGGTIYLGNGTYNISNSLVVYSNTKIIGTGKTVINQTADNKHAVVWSGNYISMQDLTIKLSGACTELTGCIFVNCNNTDGADGYPVREQVNNCLLRDVILLGTYEPSKDSNGIYYLSEEMQNYRGCGLYADRMYFLYSDFSNVEVKNLYAGIYGGSGANRYGIYETYCRYAVYGGGRNNMFEISGHSGYYVSNDGTIFGTTEYDCYVTGHFNTFNVKTFDTQFNTTGHKMYFSPLSLQNSYDIGHSVGESWSVPLTKVQDHGTFNKCLSDLKLVPFAMGQRLVNIAGITEFKYTDGATSNALAGAGIWGNITSNAEWDETYLPLKDVCRYPKDDFFYSNELAFTRSNTSPSEDNPLEIVIDLKDRPIVSNGGMWIQFDYRYVAQAFTVTFYGSSGNEISTHTRTVTSNHQTLWNSIPHPNGSKQIYKIKIAFTKALQIPDFQWKDVAYETHTTDYNPDGLIGIVNIGAVYNEPYGRAYLGECGGNLYGNVDMHGNTLKNLPTPTEDGDAIPKSYLDGRLGDIKTTLDRIIAIQEQLMGSTETITFTIGGISCTAEKGMTWGEWVDSEYNTKGALIDTDLGVIYFGIFTDVNGDTNEGMVIGDEDTAEGVQLTEVIVANGTYILI